MNLTISQARFCGLSAGFTGPALDIITAIAQAESGLDPLKRGILDPRDRGILQINSFWHPEVSDQCAFDPACSFRQAYLISDLGTNFSQWTTYKNDAYKEFLMSEVAQFVEPVNQFEGGESAYECVAFSAALIFYSTAPGSTATNPYTSEQVDTLADKWYATEEGSSDASNTNGMDLPAEHDMLNGMGLSWYDLGVTASSEHASDMANVAAALLKGYPVMICGAETGFVYAGSEAVPYTWAPTGNHCIVATCILPSGNFGVRDMAALANGNLPGTLQEYDNSKMDLISATAIIPSWKKMNPNITQAATDTWNATGLSLPQTTGIGRDWTAKYESGILMPPPTTKEFATVNWSGKSIVAQIFGPLRCEWDGSPHWFLLNGGLK